MTRIVPFLVSLLGIAGLALAMVYIWLVFVAFQPDGAWATNLLIGPSDRDFKWTFLTVLIPYFLLVAHLYLRTELGHWLVRKGDFLGAIAFTEDKLTSNLLRSRRESQSHRLALGKAYAAMGRYAEALDALTKDFPGAETKRDRARFARWQVEVCLKLGRMREVREIVRSTTEIPKSGRFTAEYWGAVAEYFALEGERRKFDEAAQEAAWADESAPRARLCQVLFALTFDPTRSRATPALEILEAITPELRGEMPSRSADFEAWKQELTVIAGNGQVWTEEE